MDVGATGTDALIRELERWLSGIAQIRASTNRLKHRVSKPRKLMTFIASAYGRTAVQIRQCARRSRDY